MSNTFNSSAVLVSLDNIDRPLNTGMEAKTSPNSTLDSGASSDETGLALLPKSTKVVIAGNNRTKRALVGQVSALGSSKLSLALL